MAVFSSELFTNIVITFLTLFIVGVIYIKWAFNYWKRKGVQFPPPSIPLGNIANIMLKRATLGQELKNIYDEWKNKGLKYAGMYFFTKPVFTPFDPELIKIIMTKDFQYFTDHGNYVNEEVDPLTGHLFSLKGLKWRNLRAKLTPTFTSGKMKMMFQTLVDCSDELINIMDEASKGRDAVDIKDVVGRYTTDIIGSCAFGIECNSLKNPNSEFREYGKKVFKPDGVQVLKNFFSFSYPAILDLLKVAITRKDVTKFFMDVVNETVNYREANNVARKDFMHLLIQLKNNVKIQEENNDNLKQNNSNAEVGKTLTIPEIAAQAFVFFLAGFETSSTTLTFCFYELTKNPEVQDKLRQEINDVLEKHNGKLSYEAIMEMTYMDKCVNETLRKYPPLPLLNRECNKAYKVPDSEVTLEKGTLVFIPILGIQRDPEHYPDPEKFDPERFSPENKAKRHAFTWLPFGEGPRACIGLRFGLMQTKVALAVLLKNYKFTLNYKTEIPLVFDPNSFILSVKSGVWLDTEKLNA